MALTLLGTPRIDLLGALPPLLVFLPTLYTLSLHVHPTGLRFLLSGPSSSSIPGALNKRPPSFPPRGSGSPSLLCAPWTGGSHAIALRVAKR